MIRLTVFLTKLPTPDESVRNPDSTVVYSGMFSPLLAVARALVSSTGLVTKHRPEAFPRRSLIISNLRAER